MEEFKNLLCLVIAETEISQLIESLLRDRYLIRCQTNEDGAIAILRMTSVSCIVAHIDGYSRISRIGLIKLKTEFPMIPMIAISSDHDLELVRFCGEVGVDYVVSAYELQNLIRVIPIAILKKSTRVSLEDLGMDPNRYPILVQRALGILEERCLQLKCVHEIAYILETSECTLSREFKNHGLPGPKRLIMVFKIKHAVLLMKNPGLSLKEIAHLTGFSNQRRFSECFHRIFGDSPSECRRRISVGDIAKFRQDHLYSKNGSNIK